jgi:hypothetical protein
MYSRVCLVCNHSINAVIFCGSWCSVEDEWTWDEHKGGEGGDGEKEKDAGGGELVGVL